MLKYGKVHIRKNYEVKKKEYLKTGS